MDNQRLIEELVDNLSMMLKTKFDSQEYDNAYRRIVGQDRDPMLKIVETQYAAGAIFMGVYYAKCNGKENPDVRLNPSLREIVPVADKKILGFALQSNQVAQKFGILFSKGAFLASVELVPKWRNSPVHPEQYNPTSAI